MLKSILKTTITTIILGLILLASFKISFLASRDKEELYKDNIDINNELVINLMKRIELNDELRIPYFTNENMDNERLIKYIVMGALPYDFTSVTIDPTKIICEVNSKIQFTSSSRCIISKIPNSNIEYYKKLYFNSDQELEYVDFNYEGYECKNDGQHYYCLQDSYTTNYKSKNVIDHAYIYDNKIVIYDYYLLTKISNNEEYIEPTEDQVRNDGILYKHTFIRNPDIPENEITELNYYLSESVVVTE